MIRPVLAAAVASIMVAAVSSPAAADDYNVTRGALDGSKRAAQLAFNANATGGGACGLSQKRLAAMMLAISFFEVADDPRSHAASPMALSRGDNANARSDNIYLNSFNTIENRKRAFWAPGVGLFQIDVLLPNRNHWQRVQPKFGGKSIAGKLLDAWCAHQGDGVKDYMYGTWYACRGTTNRCWNAYNEIWVDEASNLRLDINEGATSWTGGVLERDCKLGVNGIAFKCGYIDVDRSEGWMFTDYPQGTESDTNPNGYTPLPAPFFSYNHGGKRWAAWLTNGTGYGTPVVRWASTTADARQQHDAWSENTNLFVKYCIDPPGGQPPECGWSSTGYVP